MSSQNLLNLRAELEAAKAVLVPQIEGLHDFARLNIKPETLAKVQEATVDFERRLGLVDAAQTALNNLDADKYPDVPERSVIAAVYDDLADNVNTIQAAFAKFATVEEAVKAEIIPGTPQEQP